MFETIAYDSTSGSTGSGASLSFSHTCSGTDRMLFVFVQLSTGSVTSVTYNSTSMTNVTSRLTGTMTVWRLASPSTGSNTITINCSGSPTIWAQAASYTGCNQTTNPATTADYTDLTAVAVNRSITTTINNSWVLGFCKWDISGGATQTVTSGATQRQSLADGTLDSMGLYDSNAPKTPAGSYNMQIGRTAGSGDAYFTMYELSPAPKLSGASLLMALL